MAEFHRCQKVVLDKRTNHDYVGETLTMLGKSQFTYRIFCSCHWDSGPCDYVTTAVDLFAKHVVDTLDAI